MANTRVEWSARTPAQIVAEYYEADFEYALNPRVISLRGLRTTEVEEQFGTMDFMHNFGNTVLYILKS